MQILFSSLQHCLVSRRLVSSHEPNRITRYPKSLQLPGFLSGGRERRCNARMQAQRRPRDCPTAQSCDAYACHMQILEEGQIDESTTLDGRGGVGQPHPRAGARGCKILRVCRSRRNDCDYNENVRQHRSCLNWFDLIDRFILIDLINFYPFLLYSPVILEVPHFASLRGKEREIVILRSDNGETWREHTLEASEEAVQDVLNESFEGEGAIRASSLPQLSNAHSLVRVTLIIYRNFQS